MQSKFVVTVDGQSLDRPDVNEIAEVGARADDEVFADLLRLIPYQGDSVFHKGVLPYRVDKSVPAAASTADLVRPAGANGSLYVYPFRAIIGTRTVTPPEGWNDIRSVPYIGTGTAGGVGTVTFGMFGATSANNRWDLVYARVDIDVDSEAENRQVMAADESTSTMALSLRQACSVTLGVQNGAEAAEPTRPSLPVDTSTTFYIPLCYVLQLHPFTSSTVIPRTQIAEVVPTAPLASSNGVAALAPASGHYAIDVAASPPTYHELQRQVPWNVANGRPSEFLPSTMVGGVQRFVALDFIRDPPSVAVGATAVLDDSIDWSNRILKLTAYVGLDDDAQWAWDGTRTGTLEPSGQNNGADNGPCVVLMGNSFAADLSAASFRLSSTELPLLTAGTCYLTLSVIGGKLMVTHVSAANPLNARFFLWIDATAQFNNARVLS